MNPNKNKKPYTPYDVAKDNSKEGLGTKAYLYLKRMLDGRYGYIDLDGKITIQPKFDIAKHFQGGYAWVGYYKENEWMNVFVNKRYGLIDKQGRYVIKPQYSLAYNFVDGIALVQINKNNLAFINSENQNICGNKTFREASSFNAGFAKIRQSLKHPIQVIDTKCRIVKTLDNVKGPIPIDEREPVTSKVVSKKVDVNLDSSQELALKYINPTFSEGLSPILIKTRLK
ncbi:MAG: WG repeat-containing protein [Candidatus Thiodiazotropha sp.]